MVPSSRESVLVMIPGDSSKALRAVIPVLQAAGVDFLHNPGIDSVDADKARQIREANATSRVLLNVRPSEYPAPAGIAEFGFFVAQAVLTGQKVVLVVQDYNYDAAHPTFAGTRQLIFRAAARLMRLFGCDRFAPVLQGEFFVTNGRRQIEQLSRGHIALQEN